MKPKITNMNQLTTAVQQFIEETTKRMDEPQELVVLVVAHSLQLYADTFFEYAHEVEEQTGYPECQELQNRATNLNYELILSNPKPRKKKKAAKKTVKKAGRK